MHVQFAHAAVNRASDCAANIRHAAHVAWPAGGATVGGNDQTARCMPILAPLNENNENRVLPGFGARAYMTPRCAAVPISNRQSRARAMGAVFCDRAISSSAWPTAHAALEIEAKILAGSHGARAGRVADSALSAGRRKVFRQAGSASRGKHQENQNQKADFAKDGEGCLRVPARLCLAAFLPECDSRCGAIALHDVKDGKGQVLDVLKM